ncbi:MAG: hypothetical protein HC812_13535 [Leptolyngbya sp. RL_3_1]|nr:hypothetical protein [Leptolyngbya sp. RL_3_1]
MPSTETSAPAIADSREACSEYVAHLQFHMTLQARNLVPSLSKQRDRRKTLLHETQADFEKMVSRQGF